MLLSDSLLSVLVEELSVSLDTFEDLEPLVVLVDELPLTFETELEELDGLFIRSRSCLLLLGSSFSRPAALQSNDRAMVRTRRDLMVQMAARLMNCVHLLLLMASLFDLVIDQNLIKL